MSLVMYFSISLYYTLESYFRQQERRQGNFLPSRVSALRGTTDEWEDPPLFFALGNPPLCGTPFFYAPRCQLLSARAYTTQCGPLWHQQRLQAEQPTIVDCSLLCAGLL